MKKLATVSAFWLCVGLHGAGDVIGWLNFLPPKTDTKLVVIDNDNNGSPPFFELFYLPKNTPPCNGPNCPPPPPPSTPCP